MKKKTITAAALFVLALFFFAAPFLSFLSR